MSRPTGKLFGWALALLVIGAFTSLGVWQLGRAKQKEAMLAASQQVLAERKALPLSAATDPARKAAYDWAAGSGHFLDVPAALLDGLGALHVPQRMTGPLAAESENLLTDLVTLTTVINERTLAILF